MRKANNYEKKIDSLKYGLSDARTIIDELRNEVKLLKSEKENLKKTIEREMECSSAVYSVHKKEIEYLRHTLRLIVVPKANIEQLNKAMIEENMPHKIRLNQDYL